MKRSMGKLIIAVNTDIFFLSHRLPVAESARESGMDVTVVSVDTGRSGDIESRGFRFVPLPMSPSRVGVYDDIRSMFILMSEFRRSPDAVVHLVGMKMILLGMSAARLTGKKGIVNAVCGLGTAFERITFVSRMLLRVLRILGRGHGRIAGTIFQNAEDEQIFRRYRVPTGEIGRTRGSGINLEEVCQADYPHGDELRILYAGRLVRSKGVGDFCAAAELLRPRLEGKVRFVICGGISDNPHSLSVEEVREMTDGRYIEWLGHRDDMPAQLASAVMIVYPSYYREGVPRVLLEASAVGRPIITTDSVGCRDTVEEGCNGYLVPVRNPSAIARCITELLEDETKCRKMGEESRRRAVCLYDIKDVIEVHRRLYDLALKILRDESDAYN